ncbi:MAG: M48 family metallopeptidase [Candidatus Pacebacteria bacterium]|nr:M48 family metallopeptidase [Candidatus Paceibacterota bacterium]MDR3583359.1 M48 family metallopeptidase [Candidatus Paceibacterota bacterium]
MKKEKEIFIGGDTIKYELRKNRRSRYMRLSVLPDASIRVTIPWRSDETAAEKFLLEKAEWLLEKLAIFKNKKISVLPLATRADYLKNKELARSIAEQKLRYFNTFYNFSWNRIAIRNQKTRWGSCSKNGNLNFSYRIIYLGEKMCDYIIVHELCHLGQFNHSKNFWALVEQTVPDYKKIRKEIKKL